MGVDVARYTTSRSASQARESSRPTAYPPPKITISSPSRRNTEQA
ncbi:MAG TPA: hypothetical protein VHZ03_33385 [Trebonia sp.]|nr:hypothetical protein [Trebonia sp.]